MYVHACAWVCVCVCQYKCVYCQLVCLPVCVCRYNTFIVRVCLCACVSVTLCLCCVHMTTIHSDKTHSDSIQVKLLQSLGLRSTLITDGSQPVNLFTTAQGLLGTIGSGPSNTEEED